MSGSAEKATRRELRRAVGPMAVGAITEVQQHAQTLGVAVASTQQRHQDLESRVRLLEQQIAPLRLTQMDREALTFWGRLRWLVRG